MQKSTVILSLASILLLVLFSLSLGNYANAGITYSRTPSGTEITSPISINASFTDISDFGFTNTNYYQIVITADVGSDKFGTCNPVSENTISKNFNVNVGDIYSGIQIYGYKNNCSELEQGVYDFENTVFTVTSPPESSGGGIVYNAPEAKLIYPIKEGVIGNKVEIKYESSDSDDSFTKAINGLGPNPVSIFYFDTLVPEKKIIIAKDLPAIGTYEWNTKDLPESFYKIMIMAVDISGQPGEAISQTLFIDNVNPVFIVKTEPAVSQGEDVKITIEPSEELIEPPEVTVVQKGSSSIVMPKMVGKGEVYEGLYNVIKGFDGPAKIFVSGKDKAGNIGKIIVGGGQFFVGIEPPPKLIIISPLDKEVTASASINIVGNTREDTEVLLTVNGVDKYKTKPDSNGNFIFKDIKISLEFNRGLNYLNLTARDQAGNEGEAESVSIKFNIAPEIKIIAPTKNEGIGGAYTIKVEANDKNKDKLTFTYEVSSDKGENWVVLSEAVSGKQFSWNTGDFADGDYVLKVTADDGFSKTQVVSDGFFVQNGLPRISFVDGGKSVSNKTNPKISGIVASPEKAAERSKIVSLEYSINNGKDWVNVLAGDGTFDSFEEKFNVPLSGLGENQYIILFRAKDSRGFFGRAKYALIVDFGPPPKPKILNPISGDILKNEDDEDKDTAGVQVGISGSSEPNSIINLMIDDKAFTGKTSSDGKFKVSATLRKHGQNNLRIFAVDAATNKSEEEKISLIYNNPPAIKFIKPRPDRGLNHGAQIKWEIKDMDLDPVKNVVLSYRKGDQPFKVLVKDPVDNFFEWDVSDFVQGNDYQLKLEATDGVSPAQKIIDFFVDNTPPQISIDSLRETRFRKAFTLNMKGQASDNFSGIEFVEYSIDGEHWFKGTITAGYLKKEAEFKVKHPFELTDGTYNLGFRAIDVAGNISEPQFQKIIIDTAPPRIGSYTLSKGILILFPEGEFFHVAKNSEWKFTISLESDTKEASLFVGDKEINLHKNRSTGLWETGLIFPELKNYDIFISAKDLFDNSTEKRSIGSVEVAKAGKVFYQEDDLPKSIDDAKITVFIFNEENQSYRQWQAEEYDAQNPIFTSKLGEYDLFLPAGKYQVLIQKIGFKRLKSGGIIISKSGFLDVDFKLSKRGGVRGIFEDVLDKIRIF